MPGAGRTFFQRVHPYLYGAGGPCAHAAHGAAHAYEILRDEAAVGWRAARACVFTKRYGVGARCRRSLPLFSFCEGDGRRISFVPACTHAAVSARNTPVFYWLLIFCGACPLRAAGEVQVAHKIRAHKVTHARRPLTWQREVRRQPIRVRPSDPEPHPCCDDL